MNKYTFYLVLESNSISPTIRKGGVCCGMEYAEKISLFVFPSQQEEDNFLLNEDVTKVEIQNLEEVYEKIVRWLRVMFKEVGRWYRSDGSKEITHITGEEFVLYPQLSGMEGMLVSVVHLGYFIEKAIKDNEKVYFVKVPKGTTQDAMLEI